MTEADVATKHSTGNMSKSGKQHNEDDYTIIDPMGLSVSSGKSSIITQETSTTTESSDAVTNPNNDVQVDKRNLIVNYLPQNINDATLAAMFSNEGAVSSAKVVRDKATKKSLGFGFVKFVKEEDAKEAISARNGFVIGNKTLKVAYARPSCEEIKNCKIYVTNLPKGS